MAPNTFHTMYSPYCAAAADNDDFITLNSSDLKLYAAHPLSVS
jgi:hypothetical protein